MAAAWGGGDEQAGEGEGFGVPNRRWQMEGVVTLPNGKRKYVSGRIQRDVVNKLAQVRRARDAGLAIPGERARRSASSSLTGLNPAAAPGAADLAAIRGLYASA